MKFNQTFIMVYLEDIYIFCYLSRAYIHIYHPPAPTWCAGFMRAAEWEMVGCFFWVYFLFGRLWPGKKESV